MSALQLKLLGFSGKIKILHLTWTAFFISFVVWFNHAPLMLMIMDSVNLTESEVNILLLLNFALPIPARIIIGMVVDRFGARISYSTLLALSSLPCFAFAMAESFQQLAWARFCLGFIGAGFVIGIRIIGDWFPARQVGVAEGIYGGWGNFGSAAATILLPGLALYFGAENGWRYAIAVTGILSLAYAFIYYRNVEDTPPDVPYLKPRRSGAMEVTSIKDLFLYICTTVPLYAAMSLLTWQLSTPEADLLSTPWVIAINIIIWALFFFQACQIVDINAERLSRPIDNIHHYPFKQISILSVAYLMTFGSKLAVVSMLPMFFFTIYRETQAVSMIDAGLMASSFIVMNLIARPVGGWLSDRIGRKFSLTIFLAGTSFGYYLMSFIAGDWPILMTISMTVLCSIFLQAAEGAVFAIAPLIKRPMTGQIAGIVGAYGNAGAIFFLALMGHVAPSTFFIILAVCALASAILARYLEEPKEFITEVMPDGTLVKIELD